MSAIGDGNDEYLTSGILENPSPEGTKLEMEFSVPLVAESLFDDGW